MRKVVNIGKLISLVENYPILWDCRRLDLATKLEKQQIWVGICRKMLPNFDQCTQSKQDKSVNQLKSIWKEVYSEHRKCKLKRKHYRFAHLLKFIDEVLDVLGRNTLANKVVHANDEGLAFCQNKVSQVDTQIKEEVTISEPVSPINCASFANHSINIVETIKTENEFENNLKMVKVEIIEGAETSDLAISTSGQVDGAKATAGSSREHGDRSNYNSVSQSAPTVLSVHPADSRLNENLMKTVKSESPDDSERLDDQAVHHCRSCTTCDGMTADRQWLLSLEPDYCNLTAEQKLDFRIQCLEFFRNAMKQRAESQHVSFSNMPEYEEPKG